MKISLFFHLVFQVGTCNCSHILLGRLIKKFESGTKSSSIFAQFAQPFQIVLFSSVDFSDRDQRECGNSWKFLEHNILPHYPLYRFRLNLWRSTQKKSKKKPRKRRQQKPRTKRTKMLLLVSLSYSSCFGVFVATMIVEDTTTTTTNTIKWIHNFDFFPPNKC